MKKGTYLNRLIALIMAGVMLLSLVVFDGSIRTRAEDENNKLTITAELVESDYAVDVSDSTDGDLYDIYVDKTSLNNASGATVKVKLEIVGVATTTEVKSPTVSYTYTEDSQGATASADQTVTADADDCYYVTLTASGTYEFKVTDASGSATTTKTVKFAESDSVNATTSTDDGSAIIKINTASGNTSSYTSISDYNSAVTGSNIWISSISSLGIVFKETNTFISSASVTYEAYTPANNALSAANNVLFSESDINASSYDFSNALSAINNSLSDGQFKLTFSTTSYLGTVKSVTLYAYIDSTAPTIALTTNAGSGSAIADTAGKYVISGEDGETLTVTITDESSGLDTTNTSVSISDGSTSKNLTGDSVYSCTFGGTGDYSAVGTYTLSVTATDKAGNTSTRTLTVIVDDEAPEVAVTKVTVDGTENTDLDSSTLLYVGGSETTATFTVSGYGITAGDVSYSVSVGGTTKDLTPTVSGPTAAADGTNTITYTFTLTDNGKYSFIFTANAHYATTNKTSKTFEFIVYDTKAPSITSGSLGTYNIGSDGVYYFKTYPTINVSSSDNYALDYVSIEDSSGNIIYKNSYSGTIVGTSFNAKLTKDNLNENQIYTISFHAKDKAGNESVYDTTYKIAVDTSAPTVSIGDLNEWNSSDVTVNVSAADNLCLASIKVVATRDGVSLDDTTYDMSGTSASKAITYSTPGKYVLNIYAYDAAGNESTVATKTFVIDTEAPEIDITGIPEDGIYVGNKITITATDDYGISASDVTITLHYQTYDHVDGDTSTEGTRTYTGTANTDSKVITAEVTNCPVIDDEPMIYYFTVTARDKSGNETTKYTSKTFYYDATAPELTVNPDLSEEDTVYYNSDVTFTIKVEEQLALGTSVYIIDKTAYSLSDGEDDYAENAYSTFAVDEGKTAGKFTQKVSAEGTYNWVVVAVDAFGNEAAVENIDFVIDKTNPVAEVDGVPENGLSTGTTVSIIITDNEALDASSFTVKGYWKTYDSSTYNEVNVTVKSVSDDTLQASMYCGEKNGKACQYYFTVTGYDRAGNAVEYTRSDSNLKVDATAPTVTITPDPADTNDGYYKGSVSFTINVTEQFSNTTTIKVSDANKATNGDSDETYYLNGTSGSYTIKRNSQGIYKLNITVTDAFGNKTNKTVEFVIDKTKPEITIGTVNKVNNGNVSVKVNITDNYKGKSYRVHVVRKNSAGTVVYDKDILDEEWNNKSVSPTLKFTDEGDYTVTVYSTDKAGNEAEVDRATFRIDKTAPVLSITGVADTQTTDCTATMSISEAFAFSFDGTTLGANDISVTITKKTDGTAETTVATLNTSNFSSGNPHTATYSFSEDGEYTITFTAKDLSGNTATTVTKTFKIDKTAPEISVTAVNKANSEVSGYDVIGGSTESDTDYVSMRITISETFFASNNVTIKVTKDGADVSSEYFTNFSSSSAESVGTQEFLEDGVYTIDITAVDALGNTAEAYNLVFTIDNTAPEIVETDKLSGFLKRMTEDGDLLLNAGDFADILNMGYEALWSVNDTSVFDVVVKLDGVDFVDFTDLTDGYHTMTITVTDEVGHVTSAEFGFTYDGTAPRIIITGVEDGSVVREPFTMTISLEDEDDYITGIVINGETVDPSLYEETNIYEYQVEEYGDYEVVVYAEDVAGNTASTIDSETGETFSFSLKEQTSVLFIILIIILILLLILIIILLVRRSRRKKENK